jgi:hypothetical protein
LLLCSTLPSNSVTISGFADLRQTNFRLPFAGLQPARIVFVAGCAVFEESESIADQLQMSKGHETISSGARLPAWPAPIRSTLREPG